MIESSGGGSCALPRLRSQYGGGAYVSSVCTITVSGGSSIDDNTAASVSSPAFVVAARLVVIVKGRADARSPQKREFAMTNLEGDAALARPSARSAEEAPT